MSEALFKRLVLAFALACAVWFFLGFVGSLKTIEVGPRLTVGRKVVILLHGYGAAGNDLEPLAKELSASLPLVSFVIPEGPHSAGIGGHSWIPPFTSPTREEHVVRLNREIAATNAKLWTLIDRVRQKGVHCEDIYIGGFSQGGRMAAEAALRAPSNCTLGGLVVMSGGGMQDAELPTSTSSPMRVLVTHGSSDPVVGINVGQALAHKLKTDGHEVRWLEFAGQHQIPPVVREGVASFLRGDEVGTAAP